MFIKQYACSLDETELSSWSITILIQWVLRRCFAHQLQMKLWVTLTECTSDHLIIPNSGHNFYFAPILGFALVSILTHICAGIYYLIFILETGSFCWKWAVEFRLTINFLSECLHHFKICDLQDKSNRIQVGKSNQTGAEKLSHENGIMTNG